MIAPQRYIQQALIRRLFNKVELIMYFAVRILQD